MAERVYLTVAEVLSIHHLQIEEYGGVHGIRDNGLLESAVFRPQSGYYNSIQEEAAALMESLNNNHPFLDGNKRTAFASVHTFLLVNNYDLRVDSLHAYKFISDALAKNEFRFSLILAWLMKCVVELG
ncbi:MAG TPA: type II toxin-antitoxin system death-on-curing family toxin [Candidatus Angelobacter sp.]|jgi:death-on-curing protein|nr:type II toxin-antitoxin system death-on-curing family toxin [Candidatus Angelobacter sp.]